MLDHLAGTGRLEKWDQPDGQDEVIYRFVLEADIIEKPEHPRVAATLRGQGTVSSTVAQAFPRAIIGSFARTEKS